MKKIIALVCLLAMVSVPVYAKKDAAWVIKKAQVEEDSFAKQKTTLFPELNYRQMGGEVKEYTGVSVWKAPYFLYRVAVVEQDGTPTQFKINVREPLVNVAGSKDFQRYKKALDKDGKNLDFVSGNLYLPTDGGTTIKKPVKEESFSIVFDEQYFKSHRESGIVIKVYGETESPIFHLSPWYVDGVLKYFEEEK
ncbi:MAG: hypothetical protein ACI37O_07815 [Candidatus Avelusimicrobium sp.]|uniref:hypothetical protein n=1 Tax=Candidatus Avelusimicrobium sp. TaxID=3048833 RepID=UPI003F11ABA7